MLVLAASHADCSDSAACAAMVFDALSASRREERESSHYAEGRYFRAFIGDTEIKVSMGDSDYDDLPLWIIFSSAESANADQLKHAGFKIARLEAFGKREEVRVDL